jgi:hypothetical protein
MPRVLLLGAGAWIFAFAAAAQHEHSGVAKPPGKAPQEQAASGHHAGLHKMKKAILRVTDNAAAQIMTLRVGAVNLPAHTDHMAATQLADVYWTVPFDGWLTAYHPRLVDAQGQAVPGRLLHHVAFWNASRSDFLCPNKEEHIFGAGGEMNDWPALPGFGYRVRQGDRMRVNTMFHNPTVTSYPQVWLEVKMEYQQATAAGTTAQPGAALKSVYPTWFDVQTCGNSGYDLAPGVNVTQGNFTLKHSGILLGVGGHLHDFGVQLELANESRQEGVAVLRSVLNDKGEIQSMPIVTFAERGGYPLRAGEKLTVTAHYDNQTGKPLPDGAMGIVVGYFLPADDSQMSAYARPAPPPRAAKQQAKVQ